MTTPERSRVSDARLAAALAHAARAVITGQYAEEEMEASLIRDICADCRDARARLAAWADALNTIDRCVNPAACESCKEVLSVLDALPAEHRVAELEREVDASMLRRSELQTERDEAQRQCHALSEAMVRLIGAVRSERYGLDVGDAAQRMAVTNHCDAMMNEAATVLANEQEAAQAFESRIRAEAMEECAKLADERSTPAQRAERR